MAGRSGELRRAGRERARASPRRRSCRARAAGRCWPPPGAELACERADQALSFKPARGPRAPGLPGNFTAKCGRHALAAWTFAHRLRHNSCVRTGRFLPPNREIKSRNRDRNRERVAPRHNCLESANARVRNVAVRMARRFALKRAADAAQPDTQSAGGRFAKSGNSLNCTRAVDVALVGSEIRRDYLEEDS